MGYGNKVEHAWFISMLPVNLIDFQLSWCSLFTPFSGEVMESELWLYERLWPPTLTLPKLYLLLLFS